MRVINDILQRYQIHQLTFVDVGAKDDIEYVKGIESLIELHAFEPNTEEFKKLLSLYEKHPFKALYLNAIGLSDYEGIAAFFITKHASMSSLLEGDMENYNKHFGTYKEYTNWENDISEQKNTTIDLQTLDNYFQNNTEVIDYLKIDTQGSELSILKGAEKLIQRKQIHVIKVEVSTIPVYKNQALFSDIDIYLRQHDYVLVDFITYQDNFDSVFNTKKQVRHSSPCGDAIYVLNNEINSTVQALKNGMILNWLGYNSIAEHIMIKAGIEKKDIEQLRYIQKINKQALILRIIKNITPPLLLRCMKQVVWHLRK